MFAEGLREEAEGGSFGFGLGLELREIERKTFISGSVYNLTKKETKTFRGTSRD